MDLSAPPSNIIDNDDVYERIPVTDPLHWRFRYQGASIYLNQGENNEKFFSHPRDPSKLPSYLLVHSRWFYVVDLFASIVLLLLALIENPAFVIPVPIWLHAVIEMICLFFIGLQLFVRVMWMGLPTAMRHKRTVLKFVALLVMFVESIVIIGRQAVHIRYTRAFRPIFLIDSHYCYGVRRFARQIMLSLPKVAEILFVLLLIMTSFSIVGYFMFHDIDELYFDTPTRSFISFFVLLTSANYPDVMMPAYSYSRWSASFFIAYISLEMFFMMNLLLAVVYDSFNTNEKVKFRKLYLHRREACRKAYKLLATDAITTTSSDGGQGIKIEQFCGFLQYYRPNLKLKDIYLKFRALNQSGTYRLSLQEFYQIYDIAFCSWDSKDENSEKWFNCLPKCAFVICDKIYSFVHSFYFQSFMVFVAIVDLFWFIVETYLHQTVPAFKNLRGSHPLASGAFISVFAFEILLKLLALGPNRYFKDGWNVFDFVVTVVASIGALCGLDNYSFAYFIVFRCFDVLRFMCRWLQTYKDIFKTLRILMPRLISAAVAFIIIYYFFGIIGIEAFFSETNKLKVCARNSSVGLEYDQGYFYLNSFENILISGVTLFELTVVNNWFVTMEGFAACSGEWSRIYFMCFYLVIMVVLTIVVTFIVETFLFRIQCRREASTDPTKNESQSFFQLSLQLNSSEVAALTLKGDIITESELYDVLNWNLPSTETTVYTARRPKTRFDFSARLYAENIENWIAESEDGDIVTDLVVIPI